jgi:hypothetical protein
MLTKPNYGRLFFEADKGDGESGGSKKDESAAGKESQDAQPGGEQGETGFKPITSEAELSQWKSNTRKLIADEVRSRLDEERQKQDEEAKQARERDEAEKRGEFDKVRVSLETERDTFKATAATLAERVEQYESLAMKRVDALKDELKLPDEVMKRFPADADALAKLSWLEEQGELAKLYRTQQGGPKDGVKHPETPDANGNGKPLELTKEQQAALDRQFARSF